MTRTDRRPADPPSGVCKALCIGIDEYPGRNRLDYCVADALAWRATLRRLGFEVETLLDGEATHEGILQAMARTVGDARAGDTLCIQYAGHGIRFPDSDGDEEDAHDEALVPVDSAHQLFVSDDELWEVLQSGADGVELYVFMDCCHSRSNTRSRARARERPAGAGRRARQIVPDGPMIDAHRRRVLPRRRARGVGLRAIESMRHVKFSACHDLEEAFEENGQGNFTRAALKVLPDLEPGTTNEALRLAIEESFVPDARQHPGLECPTRSRGRPFMEKVYGLGDSAACGSPPAATAPRT